MIHSTGERTLDFGAAGMRWEITHSTGDTGGAYFEAINVVGPGFGGPPLHVHPHAEESYAVTQGSLEVCVDGAWRTIREGESVTVLAGTPHTLRNTSGAVVRLVNRHAPALEFERFFRRLHAMAAAGQVVLSPRNFAERVRLSMLFVEHQREILSVRPPHLLMRLLATAGRMLGYRLP